MRVLVLTVTLYAPWVHSLKEKRMLLRSLTTRLRGKFNLSVCECGAQDMHQTAVIGVAAVAADTAMCDSIAQSVLGFIEGTTEAEITSIEQEIL